MNFAGFGIRLRPTNRGKADLEFTKDLLDFPRGYPARRRFQFRE